MITSNPFIELSAVIPPGVMQAYVVLMILLVIGGTLLDVKHKKSAQYFFEKGKSLKKLAKREVGSSEKMSLAVSTLANEVLASGEFENPDRRKSHLMHDVRLHRLRGDDRADDLRPAGRRTAKTSMFRAPVLARRRAVGQYRRLLVLVQDPRRRAF
jgi:hypothetical protein